MPLKDFSGNPLAAVGERNPVVHGENTKRHKESVDSTQGQKRTQTTGGQCNRVLSAPFVLSDLLPSSRFRSYLPYFQQKQVVLYP